MEDAWMRHYAEDLQAMIDAAAIEDAPETTDAADEAEDPDAARDAARACQATLEHLLTTAPLRAYRGDGPEETPEGVILTVDGEIVCRTRLITDIQGAKSWYAFPDGPDGWGCELRGYLYTAKAKTGKDTLHCKGYDVCSPRRIAETVAREFRGYDGGGVHA
ncbi:MAG: hypothetical protein LBJ11_10580 [Oscillospiraceae bacterium]|jgi:hypothetical protein|nr:hypothetical protein [Oscillospiraceae bacterium]